MLQEFQIMFLGFALMIALFDGISEGLFLRLKDFDASLHIDQMRKGTDGIEYGLAILGILFCAMQYGAFEMKNAHLITGVLAALSIRWLIRDGLQNYFTKKPFFYTGTVAFLDRFASVFPAWAVPAIKVGMVVVFCVIFFLV